MRVTLWINDFKFDFTSESEWEAVRSQLDNISHAGSVGVLRIPQPGNKVFFHLINQATTVHWIVAE